MNPKNGCETCGKELKRKHLTDWRCENDHMNLQSHSSYDKAVDKLTRWHLKQVRENWIKEGLIAEREK